MPTLEEMIEGKGSDRAPDLSVDASKFYQQETGSVIFNYRDPGLGIFVQATESAKQLKSTYPLMPNAFAVSLCILALCHCSCSLSISMPIVLLYAKISEMDRELFMFLQSSFYEGFPYLQKINESVTEEKKS